MDESSTAPVVPDDRHRLGDLLERFMARQLSVERFWWQIGDFVDSADSGAAHVAEALCDIGEVDLLSCWHTWKHLPEAQRELITRCRRFLGTALPYEWPEPPGLLLADLTRAGLVLLGMAAVGHLLFALAIGELGIGIAVEGLAWSDGVWFIVNALLSMFACGGILTGAIIAYRALSHWRQVALQVYAGAGDGAVWPFLRRADYEGAEPVKNAVT